MVSLCEWPLSAQLVDRCKGGGGSPNYGELEPTVLSAKTIAGNLVHPAPALISGLYVVPLCVRRRIGVHVNVINQVTEFRVVFCGAIFELPLIRGDVVQRNGHVECTMHEQRYVIGRAKGYPPG